MVDNAVSASHHFYAFVVQLFERHMQRANRHRRGNRNLLHHHPVRQFIYLLLVERCQRKGVTDGQLALQLWRFLYRFNHIIDGCHACRSGFVQVNIDAFVVVQRNLEHGVEGFFHRAINTGRVQAADVMRPRLHRFTH